MSFNLMANLLECPFPVSRSTSIKLRAKSSDLI